MLMHQIAFMMIVAGIVVVGFSKLIAIHQDLNPHYPDPVVNEASDPEPEDDSWWREIFGC